MPNQKQDSKTPKPAKQARDSTPRPRPKKDDAIKKGHSNPKQNKHRDLNLKDARDAKPKREQPKSPTGNFSGSTFHSSPNANSLPRPPFAKNSPPRATVQSNAEPINIHSNPGMPMAPNMQPMPHSMHANVASMPPVPPMNSNPNQRFPQPVYPQQFVPPYMMPPMQYGMQFPVFPMPQAMPVMPMYPPGPQKR